MSKTIEIPRTEQHVHPEHASELLQQLELLLSGEENGSGGGLCDVVLIAGKNGQRVQAHRVVLAASSPYFKTMFTGDMLESTASEVILGDDVRGDFLLPLVQFCYTGKIEICADTVDELVLIASRLQLNAVVSACSAFMERRLDASNCLVVAELAELLNLGDLKQSADKYACKHFVQVSQEEEFLRLNIAELKVLIASDCLNVPTEESVFHSVLSWLNYSTEEKGTRSEYTPTLLALVRLSHLPVKLLTEQVWDLCQEHACIPLVKGALKEANVPIGSRRIKPRKSMPSSFLAVWLDLKQKVLRIAEYSPRKDKWNLFDTTFPSRKDFGAAFFNNELVVAGGLKSLRFSNIVESINLDTMTLSKLPSMALKRYDFGIAVLDGLLYAAGGLVEFDVATNRVERYDPNDCKWSEVAPMSVARYAFGLAELNGRLFAVGGRDVDIDEDIVINSTECYDPQTEKWTQLENLNIPRCGFGIASGNGFLYAVGGENDEEEPLQWIERYDPQAGKWTELLFTSPLHNVRSVFLDDRLIVLSFQNGSPLFEQYNLVTKTWTKLATLGQNAYYLCAVLK